MKIIEPSYEILRIDSGIEGAKFIERVGRTCYKSEDKITDESAVPFVKMILARKHFPILEFGDMTVRFICDRGVTHEIVRHRLPSFAQESTRYCNYSKAKYGNEITVIRPMFWEEGSEMFSQWRLAMKECETRYMRLLEHGASAQEARSVLPNSLKTEIVVKANFTEWHHIFTMRAVNPAAHPQMRQIMVPLLKEVKTLVPGIFDDLEVK